MGKVLGFGDNKIAENTPVGGRLGNIPTESPPPFGKWRVEPLSGCWIQNRNCFRLCLLSL